MKSHKRLRESLQLVTFLFFSIFSLMQRVTIKDLARLLSLSTSTISRALSDHPDISEATKRKVRTAAEEFGYSTNMHARLFRKQQSGLIALVLPEINMFFIPKLISGINKALAPTDYSLNIFISNDSYKQEKAIIRQCLNWAVEGVLISLSNETYDLSHLEPLSKAKIKCVLLDKTLENDQFPAVMIDSRDAAYQAISYLIQKGHQNIVGIFGNPNLRISQERLEGYKAALEDHKLSFHSENVIFTEDSSQLDFILPPILKHNKNITAIFTMSEELMAKSLYHLNRLEISIPKDMSVISIGDGVYFHLTHPQITHIKDSGSKMGKTATRFLLDVVSGASEHELSQKIIPTKLVELESVRDIR